MVIYWLLTTVVWNVFAIVEESVNSSTFTSTNDRLSSVNNGLIDDTYEEIPKQDKLSDDDKEIALELLNRDLQQFELLKDKIDQIEEHLEIHANTHIIDEIELVETDQMIHEVDKQVMKPFEQALLAVKNLIEKSDNKFDNGSVEEMVTLVENAEEFLKNAQQKIEQVEMKDHAWDGLEESQQLQDMIDQDHINKGIFLETLQPSKTSKPMKSKTADVLKKKAAPYPGMKLDSLSSNVGDTNEEITNQDKLSDDDKEIALELLSGDLQQIELLKDKIHHMEEHIRKHADSHIIDEIEIVETDQMIHEVDEQVMKPFEQALLAVKNLIEKSDHKFDKALVEEMVTVVENAEVFLENAQQKMEQVEMKDHAWDGLEESQQLQDMIDQDHINKGILLETSQPSKTSKPIKIKVTDGLKKKAAPYPGMKLDSMSLNVGVNKNNRNAGVDSGMLYAKRLKVKMNKNNKLKHIELIKETRKDPKVEVEMKDHEWDGLEENQRLENQMIKQEHINRGTFMEALQPRQTSKNMKLKSTDGLKKVAAHYPGMKLESLTSKVVAKKKNLNVGAPSGMSYVERILNKVDKIDKPKQNNPNNESKKDTGMPQHPNDSVVGLLNPNIEKALDSAAESSHRFIDEKRKHQPAFIENTTSVMLLTKLTIMIVALAVLCMVGYFYFLFRKRPQLKEVDVDVNCQLSSLQLNEDKETKEDCTAIMTPSMRRIRRHLF